MIEKYGNPVAQIPSKPRYQFVPINPRYQDFLRHIERVIFVEMLSSNNYIVANTKTDSDVWKKLAAGITAIDMYPYISYKCYVSFLLLHSVVLVHPHYLKKLFLLLSFKLEYRMQKGYLKSYFYIAIDGTNVLK